MTTTIAVSRAAPAALPSRKELRHGLHLIAAPPGEGKSFLASDLGAALMESDPERRVCGLVGDAKEFVSYPQFRKRHQDGFRDVVALVKLDPDLIIIDPMSRDGECKGALHAALCGHGVIAVVTARDALDGLRTFMQALDRTERGHELAVAVKYDPMAVTLTTVRRRFCRWRGGAERMTETVRVDPPLLSLVHDGRADEAKRRWAAMLDGHSMRRQLGLEELDA